MSRATRRIRAPGRSPDRAAIRRRRPDDRTSIDTLRRELPVGARGKSPGARALHRRTARDRAGCAKVCSHRDPPPDLADRVEEVRTRAGAPPEGGGARAAHGRHPLRVRRPRARQDDEHAHRRGVLGAGLVRGFPRRAHRDRNHADSVLRDAGAEGEVPPRPCDGPAVRRVRPDRALVGVRCAGREDQGGPVERRHSLPAERDQAVHHQRRLRRRLHGVRPGGRQQVLRVHRRFGPRPA